MERIRRDDTVYLIKGKDRGKTGRIIKVFPKTAGALVEGLNLVKRHTRRTSQDQASGIVSLEAPINVSNLMLFCKSCNKGVKVGKKILEDKSKVRFCKRCGQTI